MRLFCWVLKSIKITHVVTVGTFKFHANTQESFELHVLIDSTLNWEKKSLHGVWTSSVRDPDWWDDHNLEEKSIFLTQLSRTHFSHPSPSGEANFVISSACVNNPFSAENFFDCGLRRAGPAESSCLGLTQLMHLSIRTVSGGDQQVTLDFTLHLCEHRPLGAWATRNLCL